MSSIIVSGDTSGAITIAAPAVSGTNTLSLPANTGTILTTASTFGGTGPLFSAYQSAGSVNTVAGSTWTKITIDTEEYDTNNNFASSRFTPTVAGYYQIEGVVCLNASSATFMAALYKNGTEYKRGVRGGNGGAYLATSMVSSIVYCNGTTDYVEVYCFQSTGSTTTVDLYTYFQGFLARSA